MNKHLLSKAILVIALAGVSLVSPAAPAQIEFDAKIPQLAFAAQELKDTF
ncbi:MAG: hypothetical protein ACI91J_000813, partial [Yoonia sp.]